MERAPARTRLPREAVAGWHPETLTGRVLRVESVNAWNPPAAACGLETTDLSARAV